MSRDDRSHYGPSRSPPPPTSTSRRSNRSGGAAHLARIHGTEEDKVNCPFYFKIGACRHADRCSRLHHRPAFSPTILIKHVYRHPVREAELRASTGANSDKASKAVDSKQAQEDFLAFFEDMYEELGKFGRLEALHVCDNLGDHMIGHVYAKFSDEEEAADALQIMNGRYYDGRKMEVEFSPVTDFREARCRDFDEDTCSRGGFCNFMHIKPVPHCLIRSLEEDCEEERRREARERERRRRKERERSSRRRRRGRRGDSSNEGSSDDGSKGDKNRSMSRSRSRSRSRGRGGGRQRSRSRSRSPGKRRGSRERSGGERRSRSYSSRSREKDSRSRSESPGRRDGENDKTGRSPA